MESQNTDMSTFWFWNTDMSIFWAGLQTCISLFPSFFTLHVLISAGAHAFSRNLYMLLSQRHVIDLMYAQEAYHLQCFIAVPGFLGIHEFVIPKVGMCADSSVESVRRHVWQRRLSLDLPARPNTTMLCWFPAICKSTSARTAATH